MKQQRKISWVCRIQNGDKFCNRQGSNFSGNKGIRAFGDPVGHSLSPLLHNTAFQLLGMDCVYLAFRVQAQDLATAVAALRVLGIAGVNVTVPHKHRVAGLLDRLRRRGFDRFGQYHT